MKQATIPTTPNIAPPTTTTVETGTQALVNLLPTFKKSDGTPIVDYNQALSLTSLRFKTGEAVLSANHRYFLYEVINMLQTLDYEIVYNFLSADWSKVFPGSDIRRKVLFENPLLEKSKEKQLLDMEIFRTALEIEIGAVDCPKCKSSETMSLEKQTKSGDEGFSIRCTCLQCGHKWRAQ